jgi:predicted amidohydrolase YtcJ
MLWGALDPQVRDLTFPFLDAALIDRHYPFRDLRDAHAPLAAGSDWPVSSADPLAAIHVGVTRAEPGARADARMHPEQSLDLATALSAYTAGSATINGRGTSSGRLREGYLADLAVLSADVFAIYPHGLHEVAVRETWLAGDAVYRAGDS